MAFYHVFTTVGEFVGTQVSDGVADASVGSRTLLVRRAVRVTLEDSGPKGGGQRVRFSGVFPGEPYVADLYVLRDHIAAWSELPPGSALGAQYETFVQRMDDARRKRLGEGPPSGEPTSAPAE